MEQLIRIAMQLGGIDDPVTLLEGLFAHAPIALFVYRLDGQCVLANQACVALFGAPPPPGHNIFTDEQPESRAAAPLVRRAFEGETVRLPPTWFDRPELWQPGVPAGSRIAVEVTMFPVRDRHGAVQLVALCAKDATAEHLLREVNDALRRREEELAATLQSISDGVIATDSEGRIVRMNPVTERLTGWTLDEARGRPIAEVFVIRHEETREIVQNPVARVLAEGVVAGLANHTVLIARDGSERAISDSGAPIWASDGSVQGVVLVFRDVSDERREEQLRRKHEEELRRSEETLRAALFASRSLAWSLDFNTTKITFSDNTSDVLGVTSELTVERLTAMAHPDDRDAIFASTTALSEGRVPSDQQFRFFRADSGALVALESRARPIRDEQGRVTGATGHLVDVTERWRAEEALRLSEARYRTQFEAAPEAILTVDVDTGMVVEANENAARLFRTQRDELLALSWTALVPLAQLDRPVMDEQGQSLWTRVSSGEQVTVEWTLTSDKDGSTPCELRMVRLPAAGKNLCRVSVVDISDRRRAEELRARGVELELRNGRIQEASRMKSEFLANMSHELRTPLNAIIGFAELLHDGQVDSGTPEHKEFLGDILASGRHLLHLINEILDLAKVEAGKLELNPEPVNLAALVEGVCATLRSLSAKKRIHLEVESDDALDDISIDPDRFRQILYNYLSNALKFTPEDGRVVVRTRPDRAGAFRIEVEDTGIGIAPGDMARLFIDFEQLESGAAKKHGGTGLGLALTKRLVEAQGGSVGLDSTLGRGSVFYAVLPRKPHGAA